MTGADPVLSDPASVIIEHLRSAEPSLSEAAIREAVREVAPGRTAQRGLATALAAAPDLLTSGRPEGPPSVGRLVRAVVARGGRHVTIPLCGGCGRPEPLPQRRGRLRICMTCDADARARRQRCAGCGRARVARYTGRNGEGLCFACKPRDDIDWTQRICDHVRTVDAGVPADTVRQIVTTITRGRPHYVRRLAWDLEDRPGMLTGNAARGTPKVIALIEALREAGANGVARPACPVCSRTNLPLTSTLDDVRVCVTCYRTSTAVDCSRCERRAPVSRRTPPGEPLCRRCDRADPINHEICGGCGERREIVWRTSPIGPVCERCYRPPTAACQSCGKQRPCIGVASGSPRCEHCRRAKAPCHRCGRTKPVKARAPDGPLCDTCFKKDPISFKACVECGTVERLRHHGLCHRCACDRELTALLCGADGVITAPLQPVFAALMASSNHARVLDWIRHGTTAVVTLRQLATGECALDHDALEARTLRPPNAGSPAPSPG